MATIFHYDGKPDDAGEYYVILLGEHGPQEQPGWYFEVASEPYGPYATRAAARRARKLES